MNQNAITVTVFTLVISGCQQMQNREEPQKEQECITDLDCPQESVCLYNTCTTRQEDGGSGDGGSAGCSGTETRPCYRGPEGTEGVGLCRAGVMTCDGEFLSECTGDVLPAVEICDGLDNDCDGESDEGLSCLPEGAACSPDDAVNVCVTGTWCVEYPSGRNACGNPEPCDPNSGGWTDGRNPGDSSWSCGIRTPCSGCRQCTEFSDGNHYCYDPPAATCWSHYWADVVVEGGKGTHLDTCMNCTDRPGFEEGSQCTAIPNGDALELRCGPALDLTARRGDTLSYSVDFLAFDLPLINPFELDRCLVAWGVHRARRVEHGIIESHPVYFVTASISGGASRMQPLSIDGLSTRLPAAAFQNHVLEPPALPAKPVPESKEERAARILWQEPSMAGRRNLSLHAPYEACPSCVTFEDLINHMYPGPEIFCQGLWRDPADSQFVVPLWMPYYDAALGTSNHVIFSEMVCERPDGEQIHSVTAFFLPWTWPESLPQEY